MKVSNTLHGIQFEWDSRKALSNLRKHKIDFENACEVFFDPFIRLVDVENYAGEVREAVIGMTVNWRLLFVVYVERKDVLRIISARPATNSERTTYEDR